MKKTTKTKAISGPAQSTGLEVIQEGPIVAHQYPETIEYSETKLSAKGLDEKYAHLKQLSPDNKDAYEELKLAIADVRGKRTGITEEEDFVKKPLNAYRALIIAKAKKVRGYLQPIEDRLKKEKDRIDDIKAERKLAMQKLWQDNINSVTSILQTVSAMDASQLTELLDSQNEYDFESLDFGELIDQAKSAVAQNVIAITERIDFLAEQKRLADEKAAFEIKQAEEAAERKRLDDERKVKEAAAQKLRDDEKAASDKKAADDAAEMQRMRDKIAEMEKEAEPEMVVVSQGEVTLVEDSLLSDDEDHGVIEIELGRTDSPAIHEEVKQELETFTENLGDINELSAWAKEIETAKELGPVPGLYSEAATNAVNVVYDQLEQITDYLKATAESLK